MDAYAEEGDPVPIHSDEEMLLQVLAELQPLAEEDRFPEIDDTLLPVEDVDL